jgi:hypothetical protein
MLPYLSPSSGDLDNPDGKNHEQNSQADSELQHGFFHASPRSIDAIWLPEYASQPATPHLKYNHDYQGYCYQNLGYK